MQLSHGGLVRRLFKSRIDCYKPKCTAALDRISKESVVVWVLRTLAKRQAGAVSDAAAGMDDVGCGKVIE